jgi:hypothetical protein
MPEGARALEPTRSVRTTQDRMAMAGVLQEPQWQAVVLMVPVAQGVVDREQMQKEAARPVELAAMARGAPGVQVSNTQVGRRRE